MPQAFAAKMLETAGRRFQLDVAFETHAQRVVLFGPSGSGKTLTLQALAGLLRPDKGAIRLCAHTTDAWRTRTR